MLFGDWIKESVLHVLTSLQKLSDHQMHQSVSPQKEDAGSFLSKTLCLGQLLFNLVALFQAKLRSRSSCQTAREKKLAALVQGKDSMAFSNQLRIKATLLTSFMLARTRTQFIPSV